MIAWNVFKRPIKKNNLEAWSKLLDDTIKAALIALPATIYSELQVEIKLVSLTFLLLWIYISTVLTTTIRNGLD